MNDLGDIAGLVAASAFLILALAIAVPLVRLGKVMDEASRTIRTVTDEVLPIIKEVQFTVHSANSIVARVKEILDSAAKVAEQVKGLADHPAAALLGLAKSFKNFIPGSTRE